MLIELFFGIFQLIFGFSIKNPKKFIILVFVYCLFLTVDASCYCYCFGSIKTGILTNNHQGCVQYCHSIGKMEHVCTNSPI
jgi:hypothetical protein